MFSQDEIDSVLSQAKEAVDALASDVGEVTEQPPGQESSRESGAVARRSSGGEMSGAFAAGQERRGGNGSAGMSRERLSRILKLRVPVVVKLGQRRMLLSEVLKMGPGMILEFDRTVDSPLDLMVNNRQIGSGVAVKVDEHFGLRVTNIGDLRERISSFAG